MDNNQIDNNKNLTNDPKSNNQSRSIRNIETMFDGSRGHLTDFEGISYSILYFFYFAYN